ncbi:MAG: hypothetical protein RIM33_11475 [Alphaproteobacteria bacterium]
MFQLAGIKWLSGAVALGILIYLGLELLFIELSKCWSWISTNWAYRLAVLITAGLVSAVMVKWRLFWKIPMLGPWLAEKLFPDLNGDYEVTILSNWPIIQNLISGEPPKFESEGPLLSNELQLVKLNGRIEQTFFRTSVILTPLVANGVIKESRTLSCTLHKEGRDGVKRISYVYEQENLNRDETDEEKFLGAGDLRLDPKSDAVLSGKFWTNRAWHKGYNTAGNIEFRKLKNN